MIPPEPTAKFNAEIYEDLQIINILTDAGRHDATHPAFRSLEKRKTEHRNNKRNSSAAQRVPFRDKLGNISNKIGKKTRYYKAIIKSFSLDEQRHVPNLLKDPNGLNKMNKRNHNTDIFNLFL